MLDLQTPLVIGGKTYPVLIGGIRGEWNLQNRRIEVHVGPGRKRGESIVIGTRETTEGGESPRVFAPPTFSTYFIEDSNPPNPVFAAVFQKLQELIEEIEATMILSPELAKAVYQSGEEEFSLASTFQPYAPDAFKFDERAKAPRGETIREPREAK